MRVKCQKSARPLQVHFLNLINLLPFQEKLMQVNIVTGPKYESLNVFSLFFFLAFCILIFVPINQSRTREARNTPKQRIMYKRQVQTLKVSEKSELKSAHLATGQNKTWLKIKHSIEMFFLWFHSSSPE